MANMQASIMFTCDMQNGKCFSNLKQGKHFPPSKPCVFH